MTPNEIGWARTVEKPIYLREDLHQMAKKKQFVTAAAAFAVAASAVAPAITADAASTTVRLSSDYVRGGDLNAALDKEYKGSEIHWYKSSIDMNKLGVFQTAKGFVKGKGIKVEKKLRVLNYAQEIKPESEFVFEQGVPVSGIRVQPVLFADGVVYNKPLFVAGFSTEKVGEFEGTLTYSNKAYGSVTKTVKYKVVATKVELSEVKSEVMDDVLSVTADVKNLKDGEKVELVVYANRDMNAALPAVQAEVKDGKLSVKSDKLPAGNHSFILRSGEVKTEAMNFVVEAPMVKEVKAINAKELVVTFNKAIKKDTLVEADGTLVDNVLAISGLQGATAVNANASTVVLSEDGKTATITADSTLNGKYVVSLKADSVKTTDLKSVEAYVSSVLEFSDSVRPTLVNVSTPVNGVAKFTFSEPLNVADAAAIESAMVIRDENGSVVSGTGLVTLSSDKKSFELAISTFTVDKSYSVTLAGLSDFAGNLISPNPVSATVVNKVVDNIAPVIQKVEAVKTGQLKITLSEKAKIGAGNVVGTYEIGSAGAVDIDLTSGTGNASIDSTGTVITVNATGFTGVQTIKVAGIQDLSGNAATAVSKVLQFAADQTAPAYVSHVIKEISNSQFLIVKYNEEVVADNTVSDIAYSYVDANQVTRTGSIVNNATNVAAYDSDNDGVNDSLKIALPTAKGAYTFNLPTGLAKDTVTPVGNAAVAKSLTATIGDLTDSGKPVIVDADSNASNGYSGIAIQPSEDVVVVDFNEAVSAATALNVANYTVEGVQVFESAIFDGSQSKVKLTLKKNAITVEGLRNFTIANVADLAGNVMNSVTTQVSFEENVKPVITSTKLTGTREITVTFSEAMLATSLTDADDFTVKVDGVTNAVTAVAQVGSSNAYTVTLTNQITDLSKPITLTVNASNDVVDTATPGNSLLTTGVLTVTQ